MTKILIQTSDQLRLTNFVWLQYGDPYCGKMVGTIFYGDVTLPRSSSCVQSMVATQTDRGFKCSLTTEQERKSKSVVHSFYVRISDIGFIFTGHYLWLKGLSDVPPFLVSDSKGHLDSPGLSSFYMFFTMIILLQVFY